MKRGAWPINTPKRRLAVLTASILSVAVVASLLVVYYPILFLRFPPVWPDEGLFGNPAINWIRSGKLATTLIGDLLRGMDVRTYWMPPAYFVALAGWFKGFGAGIAQMRSMSALLGISSAVAVALLFRRFSKNPYLPVLVSCLTILDYVFIRAATIGRMDIMAILFMIGGLYAYIRAEEAADDSRRRRIAMGICGILSGLAVMSHPMGAVAGGAILMRLLSKAAVSKKLQSDILWVLLGGFLALLPWFIYIAQDMGAFVAQFGGQLARKADRNPLALRSVVGTLSMNFNQYGSARTGSVAASILAAVSIWKLDGRFRVVAYCGILTLLAVIWSSEMWYTVYLAPFIAIGTGLAIDRSLAVSGNPPRKALSLLCVVIVASWYLGANIASLVSTSASCASQREETDYGRFCRAISRELPDGSKILLACIPDPYMGLSDRRDLTIFHFVPGGVPVDQSEYYLRLRSLDYIVTGRDPITAEIGEFLRTNGSLVSVVGTREGSGYYSEIYRIFPDSGVF